MARPLRIAMVIDAWDEAANGGVISTRRFTDLLRDRGHTVEVLTTGRPAPGKVVLREFHIPLADGIMRKMRMTFAWPDARILGDVLSRQDVVHIQFPFYLGIKAIDAARRAGVPVVSTFHVQAEHLLYNVGIRSPHLIEWVYRFFLHTTYNRSDRVICPSPFAEQELRRYGLRVPSTVISNGVPPEYRPLQGAAATRFPGKFVILTVGRLAREKQHGLLIDAIRRSRHQANIQLLIMGTGPLREELEERGRSLANPPVMGFVPPADLIPVYGAADLCVHAAEAEIEGMSVLEAIACGLPCLIARSPLSATAQFALSEDFVFESGSVDSLTARIDYWMEHPGELAAARDGYRRVADRYRIDRSLDQLVEVYREVVGGASEKPAASLEFPQPQPDRS